MNPERAAAARDARTILITAGRIPAALDLARRFAARGHRVIASDALPDFICRRSSAVAATYRTRPPTQDPQGFKEDILRIVRREKVELLVPGCEDILYLAAFREELPPYCTPFFESLERLYSLHHKLSFQRRARRHGLRVPETAELEGPERRVPEALAGRELVLKPALSRGGAHVSFLDAGAPVPPLEALDEPNRWLAQARVRGRILCSLAVADKGRVLTAATYEPVYTNEHIAVCFRPLQHAGIDAWVRRFAGAEAFSGFIAFDFIEDSSGEVWGIECNPRATSGVHVMDRDELMDAILSRRQAPRPGAVAAPLTMLGSGMFASFVDMVRERRRFDLPAFAKTVARAKEVLFDRRDPWPFVTQPLYMLKTMKMMKEQNITLCDWSYWGITWEGRGRRDALEHIGDAALAAVESEAGAGKGARAPAASAERVPHA